MLVRFGSLGLNHLRRCFSVNKEGNFYSTAKNTSSCISEKCSSQGERAGLMDIACKIAVVTGGTSGIGYATAQQLLCNGVQKVIIASNDTCGGPDAASALNNEFGKEKVIFYSVDVTCSKQYEGLFKEVLRRFKRLDILCNNAGMMNDRQWELEVDINLKGMIRGNILAFKYMAINGSNYKGNGGVVINMAAIQGLEPLPPIPIYSSTKYGVIGLTKCFGDEYHSVKSHLRVVALCPGATKTQLMKLAPKTQLCNKWGRDGEAILKSSPQQPASDVGKAVVHLAKYAEAGTIWTIEGSNLYHTSLPGRKDFSRLVKTFR